VLTSPAFGQADLTNCERELIHLAGSVQPHGVLLVLREPDLTVVQASANCETLLGWPLEALLDRTVDVLGGDLARAVRELVAAHDLERPVPLRARTAFRGGADERQLEGSVHRTPRGGLVVELERVDGAGLAAEPVTFQSEQLKQRLAEAVQRFSTASNFSLLFDSAARCFRDITGYDRVMVYKFDPDGHGQIIAEARDPRIESLLGHHYPATDIPQRARELYIRNRVRVLVDVHYQASALMPRSKAGEELDMSLCYLRSMSPLHIQYLKNMGVTATLVASLVRDGRLWGLVACHHYSPRNLRYAVRAACEMFAEVISTRIAAIENYAHAQVAMLVRRLEQRLIEATASEGDWRLALFRNPRALLQPLDASGAALFYEGEVLTTGDVPSTPELRALLRWIDERSGEALFSTSSIAQDDDSLRSLTPTASGVLAVRLSAARSEYLMWFRREQLNTVTWAGDPSKPMIGNDPLELSPRRSFAAWSEIVRGTAVPWTGAEITLARAIGVALVDIIAQIHGVRLLISEQQMSQVRATVESSNEPVIVADLNGRVLATSVAFRRLCGDPIHDLVSLDEFAARFTDPESVGRALERVKADGQSWRGELALARRDGATVPVTVRAEAVPGREGRLLGFIVVLFDLSDKRRTTEARRHLEQALLRAERGFVGRELGTVTAGSPDEVIAGILANANLAAMDLADAEGGVAAAPLLEEVEASTIRAAALYEQIRSFGSD